MGFCAAAQTGGAGDPVIGRGETGGEFEIESLGGGRPTEGDVFGGGPQNEGGASGHGQIDRRRVAGLHGIRGGMGGGSGLRGAHLQADGGGGSGRYGAQIAGEGVVGERTADFLFSLGGYFHAVIASATSSSHCVSGLYSGGLPMVGQIPPPPECSFHEYMITVCASQSLGWAATKSRTALTRLASSPSLGHWK